MLKDINPNGASAPRGFKPAGSKAIFNVDSPTFIYPENLYQYNDITNSASLKGMLYFLWNTPESDREYEIWQSNGTARGTKQFFDFSSRGLTSIFTTFLPVVNNKFLCMTQLENGLNKIYSSNGKNGSITEILSFQNNRVFSVIGSVNNAIYFFLLNEDNIHFDLWKTDGTKAGTTKIGISQVSPHQIFYSNTGCVANNELYFIGSSESDLEIWKINSSDQLVQLTNFPAVGLKLETVFNGSVLFFITDYSQNPYGQTSLNTLNVTDNAITKVFDFPQNEYYVGGYLSVLKNTLFLSTGHELFKLSTDFSATTLPTINLSGLVPVGQIDNRQYYTSYYGVDGQQYLAFVEDTSTVLGLAYIDDFATLSGVGNVDGNGVAGSVVNNILYLAGSVIKDDYYDVEPYVLRSDDTTLITWTGAKSSDWFDAENWAPEQVPTSDNNVLIPAGEEYLAIINSGEAKCNKLTVGNGATLSMTGGLLSISGKITASSADNFSLTGGKLLLFGGSRFPNNIVFNKLELRNIDDDLDNNFYEFGGETVVKGKMEMWSLGADNTLPLVELRYETRLSLEKDLKLTTGKIVQPQITKTEYGINLTGSAAQRVESVYPKGLSSNIIINNPQVVLAGNKKNPLQMGNLVVNKTFDLACANIFISGKIVYADDAGTELKIANSKPRQGSIAIGMENYFAPDSKPQLLKVDAVRTIKFCVNSEYVYNDTLILAMPLKADTIKVWGYLDMAGKDVTVGSVNNSKGYLDAGKLGTSVPTGTLNILGNSNLTGLCIFAANSLNNLYLNNPAGILLNNANLPDDDKTLYVYGTIQLKSGYFDLDVSEIKFVKAMPDEENKGRIKESAGNIFTSSSPTQAVYASLSKDTVLNAAANKVNIGNLGFIFSTAKAVGNITVKRIPVKVDETISGRSAIPRAYYINNIPAVTEADAKISLRYDEVELGGIDESTIAIYRLGLDGEWVMISSIVNASTNTVTMRRTISELDMWDDGFTVYTLAGYKPALKMKDSALYAGKELMYKEEAIKQPVTLSQNIPNPASTFTNIGYTLPQNTDNAYIKIYDANGNLLQSVKLTGSGKNNITIQTVTWAAGTYIYALVSNGKLIATKKLVVVK